jgi:hypothetical protein
MDLGKTVEYDLEGKELWSKEVPGVWSATPLKNGNILAVSNRGFVRELNRRGETVWEWTPADDKGCAKEMNECLHPFWEPAVGQNDEGKIMRHHFPMREAYGVRRLAGALCRASQSACVKGHDLPRLRRCHHVPYR